MKRKKAFDYSPLVPDSVLRLISAKPLNRIKLPMMHIITAGVLFFDITDFTSYTELASSMGHYGIEIITGVLNQFYERVVKIISNHHGEVVKYGGDSCLSIFEGQADIVISEMFACKEAILKCTAEFAGDDSIPAGFDFQVHGSISYGEVNTYIVGTLDTSLNYFLGGAAVRQAYELSEKAKDGEIIYSEANIKGCTINANIALYRNPTTKLVKNRAKLFVPQAVKNKLTDRSTNAELRKAAIIFINIISLEEDDIIPVQEYQNLYQTIQRWVGDFDGTINKVDYSDKGYLVIIAFGVPQSHQDLIERAFMCAWRIHQTHTNLKIKIGITGCTIYAGTIGSPTCYEYGIIGNGVNIAARLMYSAGFGEIILSESIVEKIQNRFKVSFIRETTIKGIKERVRMYRLIGELPENWYALQQNYVNYPVLAREKLIKDIKNLLAADSHNIVLVVGASGYGKSYLVFQVGQMWVESKKEIFYYAGDQITNKRRLEFFFQILRRYLGIINFSEEFNKLVLWGNSLNLKIDIELLNKWLLGKHGSEIEPGISPDLQYEYSVFTETINLISFHIIKKMELVIVENLEFLDSESLGLLSNLIPLLISHGNKVIFTCFDTKYKYLVEKFNPYITELLPFTNQETINITSYFLPNVSTSAINLIYELTNGNPLFIRELCLVLANLLVDKNDLLTEATLHEMEHRHLLPESLESLFIRTYDNLPEKSKTVIKLAAILTKSFTIDDLRLYLARSLHSQLDRILRELVSLRLLTIKTIDPQPEYVFPNNIVREAIYRTILLSEKKQLHNTIALKLISSLGDRVNEYLEIIAEHFIKAQEDSLISVWAFRTGQKLLSLADYESSIYYLKRALESAKNDEDKTRINLMLLEAFVFQGRTKEAKVQIDRLNQLDTHWQPLSDRYYWLYSRYLNCVSEYSQAMKLINLWLYKTKDQNYRFLLKIDYIELLLSLDKRDDFEQQALDFYNELTSDNDNIYKTKLTAILGRYYMEQGNYHKSREYYEQRLTFALLQRDLLGQRIALTSLGILSSRLGDKKTALKLYNKALTIAEKLGDRNGYSKILLDMGALYRNEGKYNLAMECYEKSLKLAEITQNKLQKATLIYDMGELCFYLEEYLVALDYFKKSKAVSEEIGDEIGVTYCNDAMGDLLFKQFRYDEAKALYKGNLKIQLKLNDIEGIGHTIGNLANIENRLQNYPKALRLYKKQLSFVTRVGDIDGMGRAWFNMATTDQDMKRYKDALKKYKKALSLFQSCNAQYNIDITQKEIAKVTDIVNQENNKEPSQ